MADKKTINRTIEIDIVRLHHASGRQRDELIAKLIYDMMTNREVSQAIRKGRRPRRHPPGDELEL